MKRTLLFLFCSVFALAITAKTVTPAASLPTYYQQIDGEAGKTLFDAVQTVTKFGYSSLGYDGLWGAYPYTDVHENGYVWDMYSDCTWKSINSNHCGNYSNECDCYNREHSIPKSWYGDTKSGPGCDIFHLVPTDGKVNGMRSNYAFGEVASASYNKQGNKLGSAKSITIIGGNTIAGNTGATISCSASKVFEPRDEYKGDFARGYFGAMIRWAGDHQTFSDGNGGTMFSKEGYTESSLYGFTKYGVALLMKWHRQDPVSQKEVDRNNGIQQTQGNRNPFIDYPYLAEYIWGEKAGETLNLDDLITAYDSRFVLGESNGYLKGGSGDNPQDQCTITWMVSGEVYTVGNPTNLVNKGGVVTALPTAPKSCDEISNQFVGWSEYAISGTTDDIPTDLFSTPDDAPDITQNTTFHAVFAHVEEVVENNSSAYAAAPAAETTLSMDLNNTNDWTLYGLIKDTKHWRMVTNSYIESPSLDASQLKSVSINMRTWGGSAYNTIEFKLGDKNIGKLVATSSSLKDYTWTPDPDSKTSGIGALRFSSPTCDSKNAPALSKIVIELDGEGTGSGDNGDNGGGNEGGTTTYVYSRYITSCNDTSTESVKVDQPSQKGNKLLFEGQLLIEYNGVYYNTLGQPVK